ncbi:Bcr/CflA family drug resistance efflux transporter, partial [Streptomyces sp. NPDC047981]
AGGAPPVVRFAGAGTAVPMAVVQLVCAAGALACFLGLCRPWSPRPPA